MELMCHARNTSLIQMSDLQWMAFDSVEIFFGHSKTDQLGENAKYPHHIFANPCNPLVCPVLALALYFGCCFNTAQSADSLLFPGHLQHDHFKDQLDQCLIAHRDDVAVLGYQHGDIGTHSIRKGATTYLSSLPGGPPPTAICIRGGWTMGHVKDIYMRYATAGDEFVGRCLCLLPLLQAKFEVSPPHFGELVGDDMAKEMVSSQYPLVHLVNGFGKLCRMCLASTVYHREFVLSFPSNHVICVTSQVLCHEATVLFFDENADVVKTTMPWIDTAHHFSGIPPHVAALHNLMVVRDEQQLLVDQFMERMKALLDEQGIQHGGALTAQNLRDILDEGLAEICGHLEQMEVVHCQ
ncbi:hypothetical protein ACA910_010981 [Epithemia clementina (nom. ined.)]